MTSRVEKILGMNARNLIYVKPFNLKPAVRLADNKLSHKKLLSRNGYPVPKIYQEFRKPEEVVDFNWQSLPNSFVIKPAFGFGGEGIIVIFGKKREGWIRPDGSLIDVDQMRVHTFDIIDGSYSLHNLPDTAFIEQKVITHKVFKKYTYRGTPDIRIIVFNQVPVMAMLRIPTEESDGKANLHAGALGVGIEMASGITTRAIYRNRIISRLPSNSKIKLNGLKIPHWDEMLKMSSEIQRLTGIGYLGIDFVLDKKEGPMILELNARPGLAIQNANLAPLEERLARVADLKIKDASKAVRVSKELFGGEIEREVEEVSGKPLLGFVEKVKINGWKNKNLEAKAKIDTGAGFSSIDRELARELGFGPALDWLNRLGIPKRMSYEKSRALAEKVGKELIKNRQIIDYAVIHSSHGSSLRPQVLIKVTLKNRTIPVRVNIAERKHLNYPLIIGRRDLKGFIIDSEQSFL